MKTYSPKNKLNEVNLVPILKVFMWSALSAIVATAIVMLDGLDATPELAIWIPIANTLLYAVKEFITSRSVVE